MYLIPAAIRDKLIIRFTVTSQFTTREDILRDWSIIHHTATAVLSRHSVDQAPGNGTKKPQTNSDDTNVRANGLSKMSAAPDVKTFRAAMRYSLSEPEGETYLANPSTEDLLDPFDDTFPAEVHSVNKFYSHLGVQGRKLSVRSLRCNSEPLSSLKDLNNLNLLSNEPTVKNGSRNKDSLPSGLSKMSAAPDVKTFRAAMRYSLSEPEGETYLANPSTEDLLDPFDDTFPAEVHSVNKFYSHLGVQGRKLSVRSLRCNSEPLSSLKDLNNLNLLSNEPTVKNGSRNKDSLPSQLPEKVIVLEKSALKKLTKYYSVPSFSQCGIRQPCCPLQSFRTFNKTWFTCNPVHSALTCLTHQS
ncbi:Histidine decarboxylase [Acipenser ruthenus]|uniref:Histidine decarboxylase n=1 Tax=Acipenser ruthenus TaxID=7906 RepID=A0A444UXX0_ACIRT|nr:Histidine decarboxylase [Acipenser ruthenus]